MHIFTLNCVLMTKEFVCVCSNFREKIKTNLKFQIQLIHHDTFSSEPKQLSSCCDGAKRNEIE